jgi:hypothetical protein
MTVVCVEKKDYDEVIRSAWSSDDDLIKKYHIKSGHGIDACVLDTLSVLKSGTYDDFKLFKVFNNDSEIGFIGTETFQNKPFLTTFFLYPEYRNNTIKDNYINFLFNFVGTEFNTALYAKNIRAINWFKKNGATEILLKNGDHDISLLNLTKKNRLCQCHQ